jgi:hypothetical protein
MDASAQVDAYIAGLEGWQRQTAADLRALIHEAVPDIVEEWKWGTPVFSLRGNVVAIGSFRDHLKVNVFKGASVPDPAGLFNAGLDAKTSRAIDVAQGGEVDAAAFRELVRAAAALNR